MKQTLKHLYHSVWIAVVALLVLAAIALSTARLLTPQITAKKPAIEHFASSMLNAPVEINQVNVTWHLFTPTIRCSQVVIFNADKTEPLFNVNELDFGINIIGSLLSSQIKLSHLNIVGADITLQQNPDGTITFYGLSNLLPANKSAGNNQAFNSFMNWILSAPEISLQDIDVNWYAKNGNHLPIRDLSLDIQNTLLEHRISGEVFVGKPARSSLEFVVELTGSWQKKQDLKLNFYVDGDDIILPQWLNSNAYQNFNIKKGLANFELWGTWANGQMQKIQTLLDLKNVVLTKLIDQSQVDLPQLNGHFYWVRNDNDWSLDADIKNTSLLRYKNIPGFTNLSGFLHASSNAGYMYFSSHDMKLDLDKLFRLPLNLTRLQGPISWTRATNGWNFETKKIEAATSDADLVTGMNLLVPDDQSGIQIDLQGKFHLTSADNIKNYLPLPIMSPGLIGWLDNSITHLDNINSTVVIKGNMHDFPFENNTNGQFLVDSQVSGIALNYYPGWPTVSNLGGHLVFAGRSMQMDVSAGETMGIALNQVHATIPLMKKAVPAILQIKGQFAGDIQDGLQFLRQSPLKNSMSGVTQKLDAKGPMNLQIEMSIPLEHGLPSKVSGTLNTQNIQVNFPAWNLQLDNVQGQFNFTQDQFTSNKVTGLLWSKPITISLQTQNQLPQIQIQYGDMQANAVASKQGWQATIKSPEAQGQVNIPNNSQAPIQANFQRIYLPDNNQSSNTQISPLRIPAVNLQCADFRYGVKQFGKVGLQLQPIPTGVQIASLTATTPIFSLNSHGYWTIQNNQQLTRLDGTISSTDLAGLLASWKFPSAISSKAATLNFSMYWPGPAYNPKLSLLNGNLTLAMQQGQLSQVSASQFKMDIGRLLSILSWQSIERRLKLDFSDLTTKGFSFNKVTATFTLQNGNAYTKDATILAPVADVKMVGRIGLAAEDYALQLSVTPHMTSSLPLIVGIAAGPVGPIAGVATWAASKLLGYAVDKISTDTYSMTGPWSNPSITQTGGFSLQQQQKQQNQPQTQQK